MLELVPLAACGTASGSPPLSSPEHGLFADWQAAQAGLASGLRPQLAASGSGGSYFIPNARGDKVAVLKVKTWSNLLPAFRHCASVSSMWASRQAAGLL